MKPYQIFDSSNEYVKIWHKIDKPPYGNKVMHIHQQYEIFFSCCDENNFFTGNKLYNIEKNDVFLFDNTDSHKIIINTKGDYDRYIVSFSQDRVKNFAVYGKSLLTCFDKRLKNHSHKISLDEERAKTLKLLFEKLISISDSGVFAADLKKELILIEILIFLNEVKQTPNNNISIPSKNSDIINKVIYYICENLSQPLTLKSIADSFYIDKYTLCRQFKKETGWGIPDYLQSCRISEAINLLKAGLSVSEVAYKTGFNSDTYFISTFKKVLGITPKKYSIRCSVK